MGLMAKIGQVFSRKREPELRTIIREYYGGNVGWFAWNYAQNIYSIPEVRTAIEKFAGIFAVIPKYFERKDKRGFVTYYEDEASRVINVKANPLQNATQFWVNAITMLMLHSNVFVEPTFNRQTGALQYLYVLPRDSFDFTLHENYATVKFLGLGKTYRMDDLIYLNRFSQLSGGTKNDLGLYETVIQALASQAINVANPKKPRAILQAQVGSQGNLKSTDKTGTMKDLKGNFDEAVNGIVYFDPQWKVTPINWQENDVNRELMQFIVNIVYNYFGMTENIVNNKAGELEWAMFVKTNVEPIAKQIEQEFTAKLFTKREQEVGNRLELDVFNLSISTLQAKTAYFNVASRQGVHNIDEMREIVGYPPLPDGLGQMFRVTADTVDITKVNEYQMSKNGKGNFSEEKSPSPDSEGGKQ
ncbi:MAG: phage portal protein [Clostridia bacterium]|nr:phage portal protein [Clostridia bacterium]